MGLRSMGPQAACLLANQEAPILTHPLARRTVIATDTLPSWLAMAAYYNVHHSALSFSQHELIDLLLEDGMWSHLYKCVHRAIDCSINQPKITKTIRHILYAIIKNINQSHKSLLARVNVDNHIISTKLLINYMSSKYIILQNVHAESHSRCDLCKYAYKNIIYMYIILS